MTDLVPTEQSSIPTNSTILNHSDFKDLPLLVKQELSRLPLDAQAAFQEEYRRRAKTAGWAYVLWLLFGFHYAYIRKWGLQVLYWVTAAGLGFWAIADLFRINGMIRDYNRDMAIDVMTSLKTIKG